MDERYQRIKDALGYTDEAIDELLLILDDLDLIDNVLEYLGLDYDGPDIETKET